MPEYENKSFEELRWEDTELAGAAGLSSANLTFLTQSQPAGQQQQTTAPLASGSRPARPSSRSRSRHSSFRLQRPAAAAVAVRAVVLLPIRQRCSRLHHLLRLRQHSAAPSFSMPNSAVLLLAVRWLRRPWVDHVSGFGSGQPSSSAFSSSFAFPSSASSSLFGSSSSFSSGLGSSVPASTSSFSFPVLLRQHGRQRWRRVLLRLPVLHRLIAVWHWQQWAVRRVVLVLRRLLRISFVLRIRVVVLPLWQPRPPSLSSAVSRLSSRLRRPALASVSAPHLRCSPRRSEGSSQQQQQQFPSQQPQQQQVDAVQQVAKVDENPFLSNLLSSSTAAAAQDGGRTVSAARSHHFPLPISRRVVQLPQCRLSSPSSLSSAVPLGSSRLSTTLVTPRSAARLPARRFNNTPSPSSVASSSFPLVPLGGLTTPTRSSPSSAQAAASISAELLMSRRNLRKLTCRTVAARCLHSGRARARSPSWRPRNGKSWMTRGRGRRASTSSSNSSSSSRASSRARRPSRRRCSREPSAPPMLNEEKQAAAAAAAAVSTCPR